MVAKAMFSSATDEWSTPDDLFQELNREFNFTLDVCASPENAKCAKFYTKKDDGLVQLWAYDADDGVVWMNPPYGRDIGQWVDKAHSYGLYCGPPVVCLLPARTDTKWWHAFIWDRENHRPREGVEVRFLKGRLKFGGSKNSAPFPSAIVIFR